MNGLHYNYVIFNSIDNKLRYTPNGYYTICMKDLDDVDGVNCINVPLSHLPFWVRYIYNAHHSSRLNIVSLPFKNLWYPFYFKNTFKNDKPVCFIVLDRVPIDYLHYLKNKYPNSKFVILYRDLRMITERLYPKHPDNPIFDLQMTIDENEAMKFGWKHFEEFESKIQVSISKDYPLSDVFFAGKGKDRLSKLLKAYEILTHAGLKCSYYLTHVPESERIELPGVEYADRFMSYSQMLYHTVNSRCVLEINQEGAVGYTSRFLEAVMFNKRLITNNQAVKKSKFYSSGNIQCVSDICEISPDFVANVSTVDYNYKDEFSPIHLVEMVDKELSYFFDK